MAKGGRASPRDTREAGRLADEGCEHHQANRLTEAEAAFRAAVALDAENIDALMNLGVLLTHKGAQAEAPKLLRRAMQAGSNIPLLLVNGANMLAELGLWSEAQQALERAIAMPLLPEVAALAFETLGFVHLQNGRRAEAADALRKAIVVDSTAPAPYFRLHAALYDDHDLLPARAALMDAVARSPEDPAFRVALGTLLDLNGDANAANQQFAVATRDGEHRETRRSWEDLKRNRTESTRFFATTYDLLRYALAQAKVDGLVLELGVSFGLSLRWIAEQAGGGVHGFDSPQELPELPPNVTLHVGPFAATLPSFLEVHPGAVRLVHLDCKLYPTTKLALELLSDRIGRGTVLVLDDFVLNERWAEHAQKALQEVAAERGWTHEPLAFNALNGQAVVRIVR